MLVMVSLTEIQNSPLSLQTWSSGWGCELAKHKHFGSKPQSLAGSEREQGKKEEFLGLIISGCRRWAGCEAAPPPVPMGTACWSAVCAPTDNLFWAKWVFNWHGNEPATSYIFFSLLGISQRGRVGIWALQRSEMLFPQTQIKYSVYFAYALSFYIFSVFHLLSMFFLSWQWH